MKRFAISLFIVLVLGSSSFAAGPFGGFRSSRSARSAYQTQAAANARSTFHANAGYQPSQRPFMSEEEMTRIFGKSILVRDDKASSE
ncbi:hypothetical protein Q31b_02230 [Novipirellula aureliae]|uniref:Uncharacterized protein n=1 Tax=Novipirellula aureliae TaxID=2527966 RepID=A0A5C6E7W2_9BACT|nr:hypothetical protein [Novipirellula aureliae]TWU45052.1 hypothetical protein Q31b_02230 [Novipirellula aureliae]